ncbi:MAG: YhcH/YjgK/YiaL family protein [Clostridia bacterium]|nr:YhcH/YjgK/YiaL family protein [Clostridia bacterium]
MASFKTEDTSFITSYETKPVAEGLYEAHKDYTDVQLILSGSEIIGVMPIDEMYKGECVKPYEYDIELYRVSGGNLIELGVGDYLI